MSTSPAGWQPDPRGRHEYRYWDGSKWTDHVSDKGVVSSDPVADETPATPAAAETPATAVQPAVQAEPTPEPEPAAGAEPVAAAEPAAAAAAEPEPAAAAAPAASTGSAPPPGMGGGASATPAASPTVTPAAADSSGPSAGSAAAETAKAQAREALESKSPDLALLLSVIAPGTGHAYLGKNQAGAVPWFALLGATIVGVILAYMGFIFFVIGLALWAGAAYYAITDLRGGVSGLEDASIPQQFVGILLTAGGLLLIISLFLPYYHVRFSGASASVSGFDAFDIIDLVLLVIGVLSIVGGLVAMGIIGGGSMPEQLPLAVAIAGAVALVLLVFRLIIVPGGHSFNSHLGRAPGILLGTDAAIVLVMANLSTLKTLRK